MSMMSPSSTDGDRVISTVPAAGVGGGPQDVGQTRAEAKPTAACRGDDPVLAPDEL
jgi:hypothetical protein